MATLVAPPLSGLEPDHSGHAHVRLGQRRSSRPFGAALATVLAVFAFLVHGYHPFAEDGGLYAAGIKRLLDPALYPHGTEFVYEPMRLSLFAPFVAALVRITGASPAAALPWTLLLLHLVTLWTTLFASWTFAGRLFPSRRKAQIGAVLLLAGWMALPVAGTALLFMDPYLTARSFSTPCMIFGLIAAWDVTEPESCVARHRFSVRTRGAALWAGSLALAVAMHPLMAAYGFGACLTLAILRARQRSSQYAGLASLGALSLALAFTLQRIAQPESSAYVAIALTRSYWFLGQWHWYEWIGILAPLAVIAALNRAHSKHRNIDPDLQALAGTALFTGLLATLIAVLFVRSDGTTHLVARLQPMRAMQMPYLVMILLLGSWLAEKLLGSSRPRWLAAAVLMSAPLYATSRAVYPNSSHLELLNAAPENAWAQAFMWVRGHTPKDALFALDSDYIQSRGEDAQCFRALAERSALPDLSKDGGEAAIAPELTPAWVDGQTAQRNLNLETDAQRRAALEPRGVSWLVLSAHAATELECPYANIAVKVCRLR
ncbi:MAG: hypothetical protein NVSMB62_21980 [Acidobacteriaceae bacterium]